MILHKKVFIWLSTICTEVIDTCKVFVNKIFKMAEFDICFKFYEKMVVSIILHLYHKQTWSSKFRFLSFNLSYVK